MLNLRYTLVPHWYTSFEESSRLGTPLLRPLWFDSPGDEEAYNHETLFFVGRSLLVAPVVEEGKSKKTVYFPKGIFYDFYTGAAYEGGKSYEFEAINGRVPLFAKAGAVIATQEPRQYVGDPEADNTIIFKVFPGPEGTDSETSFYEDDGESYAYKNGEYAKRAISVKTEPGKNLITVGAREGSFDPGVRSIEVKILGISAKPASVTLNGVCSGSEIEKFRVTLLGAGRVAVL